MQDTLLLTIFVGVIAVAALVQTVAMIMLFSALRSTGTRIEGVFTVLLKDIESLSDKADQVLSSVKTIATGIEGARDNLVQTTALVRNRASQLDGFLEEATNSARMQIAALQDLVETSARRIDQTIEAIQQGLLVPIKEISALVAGFRVGWDVLLGKRKRPLDRFQHDEEMFI